MLNRKITWFRSGGHAKSGIDRFLVSQEWILKWLNCSQTVLIRAISDHFHLVVKHVDMDRGTKPYRLLDFCVENPTSCKFAEQKWKELEVSGNEAHVVNKKSLIS